MQKLQYFFKAVPFFVRRCRLELWYPKQCRKTWRNKGGNCKSSVALFAEKLLSEKGWGNSGESSLECGRARVCATLAGSGRASSSDLSGTFFRSDEDTRRPVTLIDPFFSKTLTNNRRLPDTLRPAFFSLSFKKNDAAWTMTHCGLDAAFISSSLTRCCKAQLLISIVKVGGYFHEREPRETHGTRSKTAPEDVLSLSYTWSSHKKDRIPFGWCFRTHPWGRSALLPLLRKNVGENHSWKQQSASLTQLLAVSRAPSDAEHHQTTSHFLYFILNYRSFFHFPI